MRAIVRLATGSKFQLAKAIGAPIIPDVNTTLNEAINNASVVPFQPTVPTAGMEFCDDYNYQTDTAGNLFQYIAIGIGGHDWTVNANNSIPKPTTVVHKGRDTGFYKMMPFVVKPLTDDLTADQRAQYRLRKVVEISGVQYAAYFLRYQDFSTATIVQVVVKKVNGIKQSTPLVHTINDLVPTPPTITGTNDGTYIQTYIQAEVSFDSTQAAWLQEAAALWFGDSDYAIVSEIAICSGTDKVINKRYPQSGDQTPVQITSSLKEAVGVQACIIESTYYSLTFSNGSTSEKIYLGTEDPLFGVNYTSA